VTGHRRVVVDASVAAKGLLPETGSEAAAAMLEDDEIQLHVPELFDVELCNVLWKRFRIGELSADETRRLGHLVEDIPAERHSHGVVLQAALDLSLNLSITCYDALYIALASALDASFITADVRLAARIREADVAIEVLELT
jgi:predicted nucleic acid-binding protein